MGRWAFCLVPEKVIEEERVVCEISLEEAAGFHGEAVGPLETEALENGGRLPDFAGVEGEGRADAEVNTGWQLIFVFRDPVFLFRAAESDPDEVGLRFADHIADAVEFVGRPFAEWRGVGAGDGGAGKAGGKRGRKFFESGLFAA